MKTDLFNQNELAVNICISKYGLTVCVKMDLYAETFAWVVDQVRPYTVAISTTKTILLFEECY